MTPAILLLASTGVGLTALREKYAARLDPEDRQMLEQMERDVDEVLGILRREAQWRQAEAAPIAREFKR